MDYIGIGEQLFFGIYLLLFRESIRWDFSEIDNLEGAINLRWAKLPDAQTRKPLTHINTG